MDETRRFGRWARRLWDGLLGARAVESDEVRRLRPAADRRHRARGERGHRQDVRDRRARGALHRRRHAARRAPARHLHADGDRRAARARPRSASSTTERGARAPARATRSSQLLADGPPEVVAQRRANLARALADFDAATIATTHGFCQEVLAGLGVAGDVERDSQFVEDVTDLVERGRRRPLRAPLPQARSARRSAATRPAASRGSRSRTRSRRSSRPARPRTACRRCARGWPTRRAASSQRRKERAGADDLRRPAHAARRHAARAGRRGRRAAAARALPRRARRRVPGHRPGPVEHPAPRLRRRRQHAGPHRRPEAGDLRLPRRRRLRLSRRRRRRRASGRRSASTGAATRG